MDRTEFETKLRADGFQEIVASQAAPNATTSPHAHPFDVRALVLSGGLTLSWNGQSRRYGPGEIFEMTAGCEHSERHGTEGGEYLIGRRHPTPAA